MLLQHVAIIITTLMWFTLITPGVASTGVLQTPEEVKVSGNAMQLTEDIIKQEIHSNLLKVYLGLTPEYAASSCKQIAELKSHYITLGTTGYGEHQELWVSTVRWTLTMYLISLEAG